MAKSKKHLNLDEAAEFLGIGTDELLRSRARGLPPGKLGFKKDGELHWVQGDLETDEPEEESEPDEE